MAVYVNAELRARTDRYDPVRMAAQGRREDYALDPAPLDRGGQADVFRARHKPSRFVVAFKRKRDAAPDAVARMRREIEAAQLFGGNLHVMPVLDYSDRHDWFVMPLAEGTAETMGLALPGVAGLRDLVNAICQALGPAHEIGWIHRDLKPANLLRLNGKWTVADWGLTRRPRGETTNPERTRTGTAFERRTLRTAARFAQHWNFVGGSPEEFARKKAPLRLNARRARPRTPRSFWRKSSAAASRPGRTSTQMSA
jgi:serine/threonine protein kinase